MIDGVITTPLTTHADDRGYFREVMRMEHSQLRSCQQLSATLSYPGVIKAFHYHERQDDLWYCANGNILTVLYDRRADSPTKGETQTVVLGEHNPVTLFIPHGVVHGYKVLGEKPALVVYATSQVYDPADEFRIPYNDTEIGFDWTTRPR